MSFHFAAKLNIFANVTVSNYPNELITVSQTEMKSLVEFD